MKTFRVEYREVVLHTFYVEAEIEEDVEEKFCEMAGNGEFDFSDGWVAEGEIMNIEEA